MPVVLLLIAVLALAIVMVPLGLVLRYRDRHVPAACAALAGDDQCCGLRLLDRHVPHRRRGDEHLGAAPCTYSLLGLMVGACSAAIGLSLHALGAHAGRRLLHARTRRSSSRSPSSSPPGSCTALSRAWQAWSAQAGDESWLAAVWRRRLARRRRHRPRLLLRLLDRHPLSSRLTEEISGVIHRSNRGIPHRSSADPSSENPRIRGHPRIRVATPDSWID
jgi:hypothetical protein